MGPLVKIFLNGSITGFIIRAHDSGAPGDTFLTFNNALTGLNDHIIPTASTAAATILLKHPTLQAIQLHLD